MINTRIDEHDTLIGALSALQKYCQDYKAKFKVAPKILLIEMSALFKNKKIDYKDFKLTFYKALPRDPHLKVALVSSDYYYNDVIQQGKFHKTVLAIHQALQKRLAMKGIFALKSLSQQHQSIVDNIIGQLRVVVQALAPYTAETCYTTNRLGWETGQNLATISNKLNISTLQFLNADLDIQAMEKEARAEYEVFARDETAKYKIETTTSIEARTRQQVHANKSHGCFFVNAESNSIAKALIDPPLPTLKC